MVSHCLVAMYHYVRDTEGTAFASLRALATRTFETQLEWIGDSHLVVSYETFDQQVGVRRQFDRPTALLTFDDGLIDHYGEVLPRLTARDWTGVFFLSGAALANPPRVLNVHKTHFLIAKLGPVAFAASVRDAIIGLPAGDGDGLRLRRDVYRYDGDDDAQREAKHLLNYELPYPTTDRVLSDLFTRHIGNESEFARALYLTPTMVRDMSRAGMTFGFHTMHHRVLARLTRAEQRAELADGIREIQALTHQRDVPFCYPYGHPHTYTAETVCVLSECGYATGFTTTRRHACPERDERFEIPRFDTRDLPPFVTPDPRA